MGDIEETKRTIRKKTKNLYEATKTLNDLRNKLITVYFIKNNAVKSLLNVFDEGIVEKIKETDLNSERTLNSFQRIPIKINDSEKVETELISMLEDLIISFRDILFSEGIEDVYSEEEIEEDLF